MDKNKNELNTLKINENFAKKFQHNKRREILEKAQTKYGKNLDIENGSESSENESEDSNANLINKNIMTKFLETMVNFDDETKKDKLLNEKDPIFEEKDFILSNKKVKNEEKNKFSIKDNILNYQHYKEVEEEPNEEDNFDSVNYKVKNTKKDDKEKKAFLEANNLNEQDDNNNDDYVDDGFLTVKKDQEFNIEESFKNVKDYNKLKDSDINLNDKNDERDLADLDYNEIIEQVAKKKEHTVPLENKDLLSKFAAKNNKKLSKEDRFLRNYILSEVWRDDNKKAFTKKMQLIDREDEEKEDIMDEFEQKLNFRFEEQGGSNLTSYARDIDTGYRLKDDSRINKRKEKELKKKDDLNKQISELELAKKVKKEELQEKIKKIQKISGNDKIINEKFNTLLLEEDYDQTKFDKIMDKLFNDEYYNEGEDENLDELLKSDKTFDYNLEKNIPNKDDMEKQIKEDKNYFADENDNNIQNHENDNEDNEWFLCDECRLPIKEGKLKYECNQCEDYIVCKGCYSKKGENHPHKLKKSKVPIGCKVSIYLN